MTRAVLKDRRIDAITLLILVLFRNEVPYTLFTIKVLSCYPIYIEVYFKNIPKKPVFRHLYKMGRPPIVIRVLVSSTQDSRFVKPKPFSSVPTVSEATGISLRAVRNAYHSGRTSIKRLLAKFIL